MPSTAFRRYVALGDSFTEGVGDPDPSRPNGVRGWADRVADVLAGRTDGFGYANLAIRGRKLPAIIAEQLEPALALEPDLVTIHGGGNDVLRPKVDIDALAAAYDEAVGRLADTGATVVMFTIADAASRVLRPLRGRVALFNEWVREIADHHGALVVDMWRMRDYDVAQVMAEDRLHLNSVGHLAIAIEVLDVLGVDHDLVGEPMRLATSPDRKLQRRADLAWARSHAVPWVHRRLTGRSSGDGITPKYPSLVPPPVR